MHMPLIMNLYNSQDLIQCCDIDIDIDNEDMSDCEEVLYL